MRSQLFNVYSKLIQLVENMTPPRARSYDRIATGFWSVNIELSVMIVNLTYEGKIDRKMSQGYV